MPFEHIIWDAEANRSRIHQDATHRHLLDQVTPARRARVAQRLRYRLGELLVAAGTRLEGVTPPAPVPPGPVDATPAATGR